MPIIRATWRIRYSICRYQYRPVIDHFVLLLQVTTSISESADLERSVDATMHAQPSSPLLLSFFPLHFFLPVFVSFSSTKVSTRKKGGRRRRRRSEGKFDKFLERATRSLQMDRSIVLWYFEFGCSFCQLKKDAFT